MKNEEDSIINYVDYGKVTLDLKIQMKKRQISKKTLHRKTDLDYKIINNYVDGNIVRASEKILSKFCYVLKCNVYDLLVYHSKSK